MSNQIQKSPRLEKIVNHFFDRQEDILAEQLIAELLANGFTSNELLIIQEGLFERNYQKDIKAARYETTKTGEFLHVFLRRSGIYDSLPQNLTHSKYKQSTYTTDSDRKNDFRLRKREEKQARKFFQPIEQEMFLQRVNNAVNEQQLLSKENFSFLIDLWKLRGHGPNEYLSKLGLLIPYAKQIVNEPTLAAKLLQTIIDVPVQLFTQKKQVTTPIDQKQEEWQLGINSITGSSFSYTDYILQVRVGPVQKKDLHHYLNNGQKYEFIKTFISYFFQAEYTINIQLFLTESDEQFVLKENAPSHLGYSCVL